jgi:2-phosphoglycerate kinase
MGLPTAPGTIASTTGKWNAHAEDASQGYRSRCWRIASHRPKDLLPGDGHVIADVAEHRGLDEVASAELLGQPRPRPLVGGSAGSGKSSLGKALARQLEAGWLQLDSIWMAIKVAAGEGTRARAILDIDRRMRREDEADDDVLIAHVAASGEVCRALPAVLALELEAHERLVVDGAWLLPSFVTELELPDTDVRAVYVVQCTEADVEAALLTRPGGLPLEDRHRLMNRRIFQYDTWLADEARAHDLPVVEALPFESLLDRAPAALLSH